MSNWFDEYVCVGTLSMLFSWWDLHCLLVKDCNEMLSAHISTFVFLLCFHDKKKNCVNSDLRTIRTIKLVNVVNPTILKYGIEFCLNSEQQNK